MFFRLLLESFVRQRRRKMLAAVAILLGTTAVTAMLALATTIGDRIHRELAVYGANIVVTPAAEGLAVKVGGVDVKPSTGGAYLKESDLAKLQGIFWANNITGVSPQLDFSAFVGARDGGKAVPAVGLWFHHTLAGQGNKLVTGALELHPLWKVQGAWPAKADEIVVGQLLAARLGSIGVGSSLAVVGAVEAGRPSSSGAEARTFRVSGIASTGDEIDGKLIFPLATAQLLTGLGNAVSRVEVSARTKPEDAFARKDQAAMSAKDRDKWYCTPYANSIAFQIQEAIPGGRAEQVRRVEQSEGVVLKRISGLMWLVSLAALLAAGFAVSAAMATAVLERRGEIGLMRSLGASRGAIALLFYTETGVLAVLAGLAGYLLGSGLAFWLGARIFATEGVVEHIGAALNPVLLPVVVGMALVVAVAGSTPSIRAALRMDPSTVLRADA